MIRVYVVALFCALVPGLVAAERDVTRVYMFGNSLIHHLSEEDAHTNVPHWLNRMAQADGRSFAVDGQWGFLRNFADGLPPTANWSFEGVQGVWSPGRSGFGQSEFDTVLIAPSNFIQYRAPGQPYEGDNDSGESPLGALTRLIGWLDAETPGLRLMIYEGWSAMDEVAGTFPPGPEALARYHAYNAGAYHDWYTDLVARLNTDRDGPPVTLVPVAQVLAGLFAEGGVLAGLPVEALYTDSAPHGTPTLYLLAAMVTYTALYDVAPPDAFQPPAVLHPRVVDAYPQIAAAIRAALPRQEAAAATAEDTRQAEAPEPAPQAETADLPERQPVALPPAGLRPEGVPALGMGLNGISDWSTQHPFIDLMKTARGWVGHLPDRWGGVTTEELRAAGHLDENGWPVSLPSDVTALEAVLLTDQPTGADSLRGDYLVFYEGTGKLTLTGRARRVRYEEGRITFSYEPGEGVVGLSITETDPEDPLRDIHILREDHLPLWEAGVLFNPDWIARVRDLRSVRFMDWMMTNGSPVTRWQDRPRLSDASWTQWGVPVEVMVRLANLIGADPWFNMPHLADDTYMRRFAETVRDTLDPRLKAHVELSNEVWNQVFPQAAWARGEAEALWGESETGWAQYYGLRAAQVMDIWTEVFGEAAPDRLVRVVATHTGWPGIEESILNAPLAYLSLGRAPKESFDAYAVTGYFGYEMGGPEMAGQVNAWLDRAEEIAREAGEAQGLRRVALREFVREARFEAAIAPATLALEEGSLRQLTEEIFPYHASAARQAGLRLVMYEGGTHVAGHGAQVNDERLTAFFTALNYTPEMAKLYELLLAGWTAAGGTLFNAFVDVAPATQWGSWGALRHLDDANPRWDMLMAYNASAPTAWAERDPAAFADGILRAGGSGNQRLQGTAAEDILLGGTGNDTLVTGGGADLLHGGPGTDRAVLAGALESYELRRDDTNRLTAQGPDGPVLLTAIETLVFSDDPATVYFTRDF
ncbi:calcium-binding protein [Pseudoponticoccus marisrubri]|uniref:Type I secretion protein n=1 Tax=Pseudoponticoccus marisrubri TaxID=1685382 RepID=A0A0W7WHT6_9RHOB|nr:calcium-binding protein [Pseudoponticoccus marisrubri]KUF10179.1 type I secretion protein [Pseudoponticoccus marisrubri]